MTVVAYILGLGGDAKGPLSGLRDRLAEPGVPKHKLVTAEHDNRKQLAAMRKAILSATKVILIGYSLGGSAAHRMAGEIEGTINVLTLLDGVRPESGGFDRPGEPADMFATLPNVIEGVAWFGVKDIWPRGNCFQSGPIDDKFYNVPMMVGHADLPADPVVQEYIISKIKGAGMIEWWKENWKAALTLVLTFVTTWVTIWAQSKTVAKVEQKQEVVEARQELIQVQTNAAQATAEVAADRIGTPIVKPNWDEAVKKIEANKAEAAK